MHISQITLRNFQCFGPEAITYDVDPFTAIIGANGSGKTAALSALCRLFGTSASARSLKKSDFHVSSGTSIEEHPSLSLYIEARIEIPELSDDEYDGPAIPECFNQMIVSGVGEQPYCRVCLEGNWTRTNIEQGDIEESLSWIKTPNAEVNEDDKQRVQGYERSRIHVIYIPAIRDPSKQIRQAAGTVFGRLMRAVDWSDKIRDSLKQQTQTLVKSFRGQDGIVEIEESIRSVWTEFQNFEHLNSVQLHPTETRFDELIRQVHVHFGNRDNKPETPTDSLSEGLKSLFYITLLVSGFELELELVSNGSDAFDTEVFDPPTLTLFAIEEPENHLSPHYLGKITDKFIGLSESKAAQVVLTSHSASILGRVEPENIRHIQQDLATRTSKVNKLIFPKGEVEVAKFVKQAVRSYPELYFAKMVVLGEGDSEEIVVPGLAAAMGIPLDRSFVTFVPLGGRFVNHIWRLLNALQIPFVTLLDLDHERHGGGWGRIKYACDQLIEFGVPKANLYSVDNGQGGSKLLPTEDIDAIPTWDVNSTDKLKAWIRNIEKYGVFFSTPLDIDFLMYRKFSKEYEATAIRGPQIPAKGTPEYVDRLEKSLTATLKPNNSGGKTYDATSRHGFIWYAYLFLGKGKPSTHLLALNKIDSDDLKAKAPKVIVRMVKRIANVLEIELDS